jgi:hypothetical protein
MAVKNHERPYESSSDETGDESGSGFDVVGTLAGLSGVGYLLKRRLDSESESDSRT